MKKQKVTEAEPPVAAALTSTKKKQKVTEAEPPFAAAPTSSKKKQRVEEVETPVAAPAPVPTQKAASRIPKAKK
jgi:hypothetical protein